MTLLNGSADTEVTLPGVGEHGHDELLRPHGRRDFAGGPHRRAGRHADEQSLLAAQSPRVRRGILVADLHDAVDDALVEDAGHERGADSLDAMEPRPAAR